MVEDIIYYSFILPSHMEYLILGKKNGIFQHRIKPYYVLR